MAYSGTGLNLESQLIGGVHRRFTYKSADSLATVLATDYFALAYHTHNVREGDIIDVLEDDTDPPNWTRTKVDAVDADGNATVIVTPVDSGTATATTGAATLSRMAGKVTSESLTTAQNGIYTLTVTNTLIKATDIVFASVTDGTNTQGTPMIGLITPGSGSVVIEVINKHATSEALNGTIVVSFMVVKT